MKRLTIERELIMGGIESNPGPGFTGGGETGNLQNTPNVNQSNLNLKSNLKVRTFNCDGLGNVNKLRRLLAKIRDEVKKGGIVLLQETHLANDINGYHSAMVIITQSKSKTIITRSMLTILRD